MNCLKAGYLFDEEANGKEQKCWWPYLAEILDRLGLTATEISPDELSRELPQLSLLFLGDRDRTPFARELDAWVRAGGVLIGSNTEGLDTLFGNEFVRHIPQEKGYFSLNGPFFLRKSPFTEGINSPLHPDNPLLIASPVRLVARRGSEELGYRGKHSLITARRYGKGWAFYFGFDLAQTFWVINHGRPVDQDYDGDGYLRVGDGIIIEDYEPEVPYTDILLFLLQNLISVLPFPLLHQLPPSKGDLPDALFYYGGDDEGTPGIDLPASKFMKSRNLPYHINIMPNENSEFAVGAGEVQEMERNGTEISLHYNFIDNFPHPCGFTEEDIQKQTRLFVDRFGKIPVCANLHYARWTGWHEPALWMKKCGLKASNIKLHRRSPPINPVNEIGFSFGTGFPYFYWADKKIDFLELPITAYECGYKDEQTDFPKLEKAVKLALHYNMIMNFFYHPVYIATYPACREALDKLLRVIEEKKVNILHSTPDRVSDWWLARSRGRIEEVTFEDDSLNFTAFCSYEEGFIVKVPLDERTILRANFPCKVKRVFSRKWAFLILPGGESRVTIGYS